MISKGNPILTGIFVDDSNFIGCGFDNAPLLFKHNGKAWEYSGSLDPGLGKKRASKIGKDAFGVTSVFFDSIKLDDQIASSAKDTKHQNYINCCKPYAVAGGKVKVLSTSDPNGYINYWDCSSL